tara:strand:- start:13 stop:243 length:231 start_codon:yes stop_codon:yes gene_type:complete
MSKTNLVEIPDYELRDMVCLCHAALAQDSPNPKEFYVNELLCRLDAFKFEGMREQVDEYLAEKKYLPPGPKIELAK